MAPIKTNNRRFNASSGNARGLFNKEDAVLTHQTLLHDSFILEMGYHDDQNDEEGGSAMQSESGTLLATEPRHPTEDLKKKSLRQIFLRDLKVGKVHKGTILHGVLCCKPIVISTGIINVFEEDGTGDAVRFVIHSSITNAMAHQTISSVKSQAQALNRYPEGAQISVSEPYLKRVENDGFGGPVALGLVVEDPLRDIAIKSVPPPACTSPCPKVDPEGNESSPCSANEVEAAGGDGDVKGGEMPSSFLEFHKETAEGRVTSGANDSSEFQPKVSSSGRKTKVPRLRSAASFTTITTTSAATSVSSASARMSTDEKVTQTKVLSKVSAVSSSAAASPWSKCRDLEEMPEKERFCNSRYVTSGQISRENDSQDHRCDNHDHGDNADRGEEDALLDLKSPHDTKLRSSANVGKNSNSKDLKKCHHGSGTAYRVVLSTQFKDDIFDIDFMDGKAPGMGIKVPPAYPQDLGHRASSKSLGERRGKGKETRPNSVPFVPESGAEDPKAPLHEKQDGDDLPFSAGQGKEQQRRLGVVKARELCKQPLETFLEENSETLKGKEPDLHLNAKTNNDANDPDSAQRNPATAKMTEMIVEVTSLRDASHFEYVTKSSGPSFGISDDQIHALEQEGTESLRHPKAVSEKSHAEKSKDTVNGTSSASLIVDAPQNCKTPNTQNQPLGGCHCDGDDSALENSEDKYRLHPTFDGRQTSEACRRVHQVEVDLNALQSPSREGEHGFCLNGKLAVQIGGRNVHSRNRECLSPLSCEDPEVYPGTLRMLGNKHFVKQEWAKAIEFYTQATLVAIQRASTSEDLKENISPNCACHHTRTRKGFDDGFRYSNQLDSLIQKQNSKSESVVATSEMVLDYSNRAEAWLRLHQYEKAWADAETALSLDPNHVKSLFRKGRALLGMGNYKQALTFFQAAHACAPFDKDILAAIKLNQIAENQSTLGIYDLKNYYLKGRFTGEVPNCADYVGPVQIKYCDALEKGRGLFLTKDVKAGDLILVSNPFVMLKVQNDNEKKRKPLLVRENKNNRMNSDIMDGLVKALKSKISVSKKSHERLRALYFDDREGCKLAASAYLPPIDLFTPSGQEVSPLSSGEKHAHHQISESHLYHIVTRCTIEKHMVWSPMRNVAVKADSTKENEISKDLQDKSYFYGVWLLPSFINHSCAPNVSLVVLGRALFVYAYKDLSAGEEILSGYFNLFQPVTQRQEVASTCWSFICKCPRCSFEAELTSSLKRVSALHSRLEPHPTLNFQISLLAYKAATKELVKEIGFIETPDESQLELDLTKKNWLRASYVQLYLAGREIVGSRAQKSFNSLQVAFDAMEYVGPSSTNILEVGLLVRESVRTEVNGRKTPQYKAINDRLLRVCKSIYGKHRNMVLQSLVDGGPPSPGKNV